MQETQYALLPAPLGSLVGSDREGLHSLLRRVCAFNHLTVNDVMSEIILPSLGESDTRLTRMGYPVQLINRGTVVSSRLIHCLEGLTGLKGLSALTFQELTSLPGVGPIGVSFHRKWCPACFDEDRDTETGPYDRLLWSLEDVSVCPRHMSKLETICRHCGIGPVSILKGRDLSGFCSRCRAWLGGPPIGIDAGRDAQSAYLLWTAQSFGDLLSNPISPEAKLGANFKSIIRSLVDCYFNGVQAYFAKAIERNRSVVTSWLSNDVFPSWQALCEISYVFCLPLPDILNGNTDAVPFSYIRKLPITASKRLTQPRKKAQKLCIESANKYMDRVGRGELSAVMTLEEVGRRLGTSARELHRLLPDQSSALAKILAERREADRGHNSMQRRLLLDKLVPEVVRSMISDNIPLTRRAIDLRLVLAGVKIRRREATYIKDLVSATLVVPSADAS